MYPIHNFKIDNDKPILLVGNSPCVMKNCLGKYINLKNFNIIRFNLCNVKDYQKFVGKETSYFIINGITWNTQRDKVPRENILISELPHTAQYQILCKYPTNLNFKSVEILPNYSKKYLSSYPTSGMMAVAFFLQFYDYIYLYGFTFSDAHYYNSNFRKGAGHHCYSTEKRVIKRLEKENRIIFLNPRNCQKISKYLISVKSETQKKKLAKNEILILSTNHVWNKTRKYFHFDSSNIDIMKGDTIYVRALHEQLNKEVNLTIWGYNNGGEQGDSHGKVFDQDISFSKNEKMKIISCYPKIKVACNRHKFGRDSIGVYFHFYLKNLNLKNGQTYTFFIPKINMKKKIIIWTNKSGGTKGDAHGRYVKGSKKYDFYPNDILILLDVVD